MTDLTFKALDITDRDIFMPILRQEQPLISEYTFSNLFMWRHSRKIDWAVYKKGLILKVRHDDDHDCFLPPAGFSDPLDAYRKITQWCRERGKHQVGVFRLPSAHAELLRGEGWRVEDNRDQYDYVYDTMSLADLPGNHLDGKRGFINKFQREVEHEYQVYQERFKAGCLELAQIWMADRNPDEPALQAEYDALREYLDHWEQLQGRGGVFIRRGKVIAFTFGEELNRETFVIHFEKADTQYPGVYQAINHRFVNEEIKEKYRYVNREQDLGIPGIRKAKESYHPSHMVEKYWALFSLTEE